MNNTEQQQSTNNVIEIRRKNQQQKWTKKHHAQALFRLQTGRNSWIIFLSRHSKRMTNNIENVKLKKE